MIPDLRRADRAKFLPFALAALMTLAGTGIELSGAAPVNSAPHAAQLALIRPSPDGSHFVTSGSGSRFTPWGFNYDHDDAGRLLEDYWQDEWPTVVEDFREMRELGANVVRIHLQLARFMATPRTPNAAALAQLTRLVQLAEETGLYLDLTGLGCYHKSDLPQWYDALAESERWDVQAAFWSAVAKVCAGSPAVFCYDLMNEPVLPGAKARETEWLTGQLGGKFFVQRITLDLAGRTPEQVAKAWIDRLVTAIRAQDSARMITVGVIPWNLVFPGAKSVFYAPDVSRRLDFVSVHFYPQKGEVPKALAALGAFELKKPVLIEEMFPLRCSVQELDAFIDGSRPIADGWIGFYWGRTPADYAKGKPTMNAAITRAWLEFFQAKTPAILSLP